MSKDSAAPVQGRPGQAPNERRSHVDRGPDFLNRAVLGEEWTFPRERFRTGGIGSLTEPALDETLAQELLKDLRATQAKLEAVREDNASLKVLLALRTHQHDLAWQTGRRLEAELAAAHAPQTTPSPTTGIPTDAASAGDPTPAEAPQALACAEERVAAVQFVLGAVLSCVGRRALDRRRFQEIIAQAGREAPDSGPGAARHTVLLAEARRVLGVRE